MDVAGQVHVLGRMEQDNRQEPQRVGRDRHQQQERNRRVQPGR